MRTILSPLAVLAVVAAMAGSAWADGMIVPVRPDLRVRGNWAVKYHHVNITVRDQVAEVHIDQAFVNLGSSDLEVEYMFPIPPGAAIDKMTLLADGKEMTGKLLKADEARKIYEDIVRKKKDPALLEYVGYGLYKTSVFPMPPGKERKIIIHYTVVCKKDRDLVEVFYPLSTEKFSAKPIDDVTVTVDIKGHGSIGPVYSPTHDLKVDRESVDHVKVSYKVTNAIPNTDFKVLYQDGSGDIGATVISHKPKADKDGYFMLLVSPKAKVEASKIAPKDIVFVLDHSGSMSGEKLKQAKASLKWILENLNPGDRFNVVSFSDSVDLLFTAQLVDADKQHVAKGVDMVERIDATGGTNIKEAMDVAMALLKKEDKARPAYIVFLTDGKPTVGKTNDKDILEGARDANKAGARLFCLGVGYDVNARLMDKLSQDNRGLCDYIKPNEALEGKVSGLYAKIKNPVVTDLAIKFDGATVKDMYPRELGDLFEGDQLVVLGRYEKGGPSQLVITGQYQGQPKTFEYSMDLAKQSEDISNAYVERIWAMRRVGYLMDQIALHEKDDNKELIDELVRLARDYGIMTPYTAFLAEEDTHLADSVELRKAGEDAGRRMKEDSITGASGQMNAQVRNELRLESKAYGPSAMAAPATPGAPMSSGGSVGGSVMARSARSSSVPPPSQPTNGYTYAANSAQMVGNASQGAYEAGQQEVFTNVRQVSNQTLYRRGNQWYTPDLAKVDVNKDAANVKTVKQFTDEYFDLTRSNNAEQNQVLASQQPGEELLVSLRGQAYRILPATE